MQKHHFTIVVEKDDDGYFTHCPQLQGCYTQGETYEEVLKNMGDVIRLHAEDRFCYNLSTKLGCQLKTLLSGRFFCVASTKIKKHFSPMKNIKKELEFPSSKTLI